MREITRAVWGEDDYIPRVFTAWLRDGGFFGAELDGRLVGFAKLTRMSATEAFLEGMRVRPDARERGVGSALVAQRLEEARRRGMRVARLLTWSKNPPMHRMARRFGFRRVAEGDWLRALPKAGPSLRVATARDIEALLARARSGGGLLREQHHASQFRALTRGDVTRAIRDRRCLVLDGPKAPRAFAILELARGRAATVYLAVAPRSLMEFARRYRSFAATRPRTRVMLASPRSARRTLLAAGFRKVGRGHGVVFERTLRP